MHDVGRGRRWRTRAALILKGPGWRPAEGADLSSPTWG